MENDILKKISDYKKEGKYEEGIDFAEKQLKEIKDEEKISKVNLMLGDMYDQYAVQKSEKGKLQEKALEYFKKALDFNKFEALRGIAVVYHHRNELEKALHYYKKAHEVNPSKAGSLYNSLGNVYQRMGLNNKDESKLKKSLKFYEKSLNLAGSEEEKLIPLVNLAILSKNLDNIDESSGYARKALKIINGMEKNYVREDMKSVLADILKEG